MSKQFSPIWNSSSTDFSCILADVNDINSGSGSTLLDLKVNGLSVFAIKKDGSFIGDFLSGTNTGDQDLSDYALRTELGDYATTSYVNSTFLPINGYTGSVMLGALGNSNSIDPVLTISRTISSGSTNGHAFSDSSDFKRDGYAYNSYDARITAGAVGHTYDHYAAFQTLPAINYGTWSDIYGLYSSATVNGSVNRFNHVWIDDCIGTGTIATQYGYYCSNLTKATNNWAFYSAGSTPSRIGELSVGDNFWMTPTSTSVEIGYNIRYKNGDWYPTQTNSYYCLLEPHDPGTNSFSIFTGTTSSNINSPISDWHVSLRCADDSTAIGPSGPFIFGTISNMIQIGGVSSSFPAIKRNGASLSFRLANDSADADITTKGITASGPILLTNAYTSTTNFEQLRIRSNSTQYEISSIVGSAGGSNRPIQIGHTNAAGTFTSALSIGTDSAITVSSLESTTYLISNTGRVFARSNSSQGYLLGLADDCNMNRIAAGVIGFGTGATGSTAAEIRCGAITASGDITLTNAKRFFASNGTTTGNYLIAGNTVVFAANTVAQGGWNSSGMYARRLFLDYTNADVCLGRSSASVLGVFGADGTTPAGITAGAITASGIITGSAIALSTSSPTGGSAIANGLEMQTATQMYLNQGSNTVFKFFGGVPRVNLGQLTIGGSGIETHLYGSLNKLELRNSTSSQTFSIFETFTSATNAAWLQTKATGTAYEIGSAIGSVGGSNRPINIGHYNSAGTFACALSVATNGTTTFQTTGSADPVIIRSPSQSPWAMRIYNQTYSTSNAVFDFYPLNDGSFRMGTSVATSFSFYTNNYNNVRATFSGSTGDLTLTPSAATFGVQTGFTYIGPNSTGQTASTEATEVLWTMPTKTWATGALTTQRFFRITAPTIAFAAASTVTTASTLSISGPPIAGTNATITNSYALNVENGVSNFSGVQSDWFCPNGISNVGSWAKIYWAGSASQTITIRTYALDVAGFNGQLTALIIPDGSSLGFAPTASSTPVSRLYGSDGAGIISQRVNTNAQTFRLYNTYTSSTNNEFLQLRAVASNNFEIGPQNGSGGGTLRGLTIGGYSGGSSTIAPWLSFDNTGNATFGSTSGSYMVVKNNNAAIEGYYAGSIRGSINIGTGGGYDTWINNTGIVFLGNASAGNSVVSIGIINANTTVRTNVIKTADRSSMGAYTGAGHHLQITSGDPSGTDMAGGNIIISGGKPTGAGAGGSVVLQTASAGSTGSSVGNLTTRFTLDSNGLITLADSVNIAVNTTTGTKIGTNSNQKIGFWNANPVVQDTGWSTTNSTSTKTIDANNTNLNEVVNLLSTLINTLKTYGIIGA